MIYLLRKRFFLRSIFLWRPFFLATISSDHWFSCETFFLDRIFVFCFLQNLFFLGKRFDLCETFFFSWCGPDRFVAKHFFFFCGKRTLFFLQNIFCLLAKHFFCLFVFAFYSQYGILNFDGEPATDPTKSSGDVNSIAMKMMGKGGGRAGARDGDECDDGDY